MTKRALIYCIALLLAPLAICGQTINGDTIVPERVVVKCPSYGMTFMNNLDTYLSGYNHTGSGIYFSNEHFRDARTGNYRWKYQTLLTANLGITTLHDDTQLSGMVNYSWSGYHPFKVGERLQLLAGAQIQVEGGALYLPSNGNNPVSVKLRTALAASGMAIYRFPVKGNDWTARLQLDVPLMGVMFAPEYGQSYYEIFGLGHIFGGGVQNFVLVQFIIGVSRYGGVGGCIADVFRICYSGLGTEHEVDIGGIAIAYQGNKAALLDSIVSLSDGDLIALLNIAIPLYCRLACGNSCRISNLCKRLNVGFRLCGVFRFYDIIRLNRIRF